MSAARLFAYGGTRFSERQRLGGWTLSSVDPFNDFTGVPRSGFAVGMVWDREGAALLVRQQQKDTTGRASVFTLLLDPGPQVWEKFRWNAAAFALALFGEDGKTEYGALLLFRPEQLTAGNLAALLLTVNDVSIVTENNALFASVWTGAVAEQDSVVGAYGEVGWDAPPTLASLASQLGFLPVCFRAGTSWLIGGNRPQARSLGVRFVLNGFEPDPLPPGLPERGSRLLEEWRIAVRASTELAAFDAEPLARWKAEPGIVLERAELLALFCAGAADAENALPTLLKVLERSGPAAEDIRWAALRFATSGAGPMSASKTNFVLRLLGEIEVADSHAIGARLDPETTVAFFSADRDRSWSNRLDLPVHWRVRIWRQRLEREINFVEMNNVLENALLDLPEQEHADIIRRTISQFSPKSPLYKWFSFFEKHPQWKAQVSTFLQECARAGGASGGVESALGYLAFGNDPGGQSLATRGLDRHAATLFVDRLNQEARRESSNLMEAARAWLDAMAASEFRLYVELKSKLILARGSALSRQRSRNWRWLWRLEQLYLGRKVRFLLTSMPISERHFLRHEFAEMVSEPLGKEVPLLAQVAQLLDGIPQKLVARLSKLSVGTGQIEAWDYQLRQSGLPEAAESFLAHVTLRGLDDGMRRRAFSKVDESTLIVELTRLLRELPETETPMGAKRFADFLQGTRDERLREKMGAVIRGTWKSANEDDSRSRDSMLTGLARDPALFLEFTAGFDEGEQITLLGRLEQMAPQAMRVESVRAARLLDHGKPVDRGTTALLRFMHNPAGEQLRTIAGRDAFRGGVRAFDRQLCGLFGARRATPVRKSETRLGIFKKMFDRFQRRPAR